MITKLLNLFFKRSVWEVSGHDAFANREYSLGHFENYRDALRCKQSSEAEALRFVNERIRDKFFIVKKSA